MVENIKMRMNRYLLVLLVIILLTFLPFLIKPQILSQKDNDLGRNYIPIFNFIKKSFNDNKSFPLWRPQQLMGEPFIGNGIYPLVYPVNLLFLIFPVGLASVIFYLIHLQISATSTFYLGKSFSFDDKSSLIAAAIYTFSTKMLLHISAGHISMVAAFAFFPLSFLAVRKIFEKQQFKWLIIGAFSNALILILYPTIFYYSTLFLFFYVIYKLLQFKTDEKTLLFKILTLVILMFATALGLSAIQLLPQLEFGPLSTRSMLTLEEVALPIWNLERFLKSLIFPYVDFDNFDHEAFLYFGLVPSTLAILGFFYLPRLKQLVLGFFGILTLLFIAGVSTPLFPLAYNLLPLLSYSRVTTRLWFVAALIVALLAGYAINKVKNRSLIFILVGIFIIETFSIGYKKILNIGDLNFKNQKIYQFLTSDRDFFRVYCTTYCFNPQLIQKYNLQILHGETPIQDKDTVKFLESAGGYSFNNFAVIFPPYQMWQVKNPPIPDAKLLGSANVKYIASTYELQGDNFEFIDKFDDIYLYQNEIYKKRAYFENSDSNVSIELYEPNRIVVNFQKSQLPQNLVFSEKFYPGWFAMVNNQKFKIDRQEPIFRKIVVPPQTTRLETIYAPQSFKVGITVTLATTLFSIILLIGGKRWQK